MRKPTTSKKREGHRSEGGFSVAEVMVVMVIVSIAIVGVFGLVQNSLRLTNLTENRITAINLAREGLEAVRNIRDTNWVKYDNDKNLCWMTSFNNGACIANLGSFYETGSYVLFRRFIAPDTPPVSYEINQKTKIIGPVDDEDNPLHDQWTLLPVSTNISLRNREIMSDPYTIRLDDRALPFQIDQDLDVLTDVTCIRAKKLQSGVDRTKNCKMLFHRIITLEFSTDVKNFGVTECYDYETNLSRCVLVQSMVQWWDGTRRSDEPYEVVLEMLLTNWKSE